MQMIEDYFNILYMTAYSSTETITPDINVLIYLVNSVLLI